MQVHCPSTCIIQSNWLIQCQDHTWQCWGRQIQKFARWRPLPIIRLFHSMVYRPLTNSPLTTPACSRVFTTACWLGVRCSVFNLIAASPSPSAPTLAPVAPEAPPSGIILTGDSRCCWMMSLVAMVLGGVVGRGTTLAMSSYREQNQFVCKHKSMIVWIRPLQININSFSSLWAQNWCGQVVVMVVNICNFWWKWSSKSLAKREAIYFFVLCS